MTSVWMHRFAIFTACCTFLLIFIGGLVTSTSSGLSVPDWPTTYGYQMFAFPISLMTGGILFEHGHRMVATVVGALMIILAVWIGYREPRSWVRRLAWFALGAVIIQGLLGGMTVLLLLPTSVSVLHGTLAQTFFCLVVTLSVITGRWWLHRPAKDSPSPSSAAIPRLALFTTGAIFIQLIIGAIMRHSGAGLAIPDFPLMFGGFLPPFGEPGVLIHFTHRMSALVILGLASILIARILRQSAAVPSLTLPAALLGATLLFQITLGAFIIWTAKAMLPATAHVSLGALTLAISVVLTLRSYRLHHTPVAAPDSRPTLSPQSLALE